MNCMFGFTRLKKDTQERKKPFEQSAEIWPRHVIRHKVTPMLRKVYINLKFMKKC